MPPPCAPPEPGAQAAPAPRTAPRPGPLGELVQYIALHRPGPGHRLLGPGAPPGRPAEPPALGYFRATWARLSQAQQLSQSLASLPENAGPLNSHRLVLRALQQMRDLSPEYLGQFMAYVDDLQWLEQAGGAALLAPAPRRRPGTGGDRGSAGP